MTERSDLKFETTNNELGAREKANQMAEEFERITGLHLTPEESDVISSPYYGWISSGKEVPADDPDARYVFRYQIQDGLTAYMVPSDGNVAVWDDEVEGAIHPKTHDCEWDDEITYAAYPMAEWAGFHR